MNYRTWEIPASHVFGSAEFAKAQKRVKDMMQDAMHQMMREAEVAVLCRKPVEDMTDREKMGILIVARCEIDYFRPDGCWSTRYPCGIVLIDDKYRVYEQPPPRDGTRITFLPHEKHLKPPPESAS